MTDKQTNQIRGASKFLRTVFTEDVKIVSSILDAEANILTGNDVSKNISTLIEELDAIRGGCSDMINKLNNIKNSL